MVLHASKVVRRGDRTLTTTLCGRTNRQSRDGMNIATHAGAVTCKFCRAAMLRELAKAR